MKPETLRAVGRDMHRHACALIDADPLAAAWWKGVALGRVAADQIRGTDPFARELAIQGLNDSFGDTFPGATDLDGAMKRYGGKDPARRADVAEASGLHHGFALATERDPEAVECAWCNQRILRDVEIFEEQRECVNHGWSCSGDCRQEIRCVEEES